MARLARVVAPGIPHHVTQRGNRRQQVFFGDDDYLAYRTLLAESCRAGITVTLHSIHFSALAPTRAASRPSVALSFSCALASVGSLCSPTEAKRKLAPLANKNWRARRDESVNAWTLRVTLKK